MEKKTVIIPTISYQQQLTITVTLEGSIVSGGGLAVPVPVSSVAIGLTEDLNARIRSCKRQIELCEEALEILSKV